MKSRSFEFETSIHGYKASPFLVQYSVNREGETCSVDIDNVIYDSLELSIPDLPLPVAEHIKGAVQSNFEHERELAVADYKIAATIASERNNLYAAGLKIALEKWEDLGLKDIRRSIHDMKKNIREAPINMVDTLGPEAYKYFKEVEFVF